jgi:hypothetical protein
MASIVIACPGCRRRVFSRSDMLRATLHGSTRCRWCSRALRLDLPSRWILSCMVAILVPNALLYGNVFYSGHLFLVSIFLIYAGMGILAFLGSPLLALEVAPTSSPLDRRQTAVLAGVVLVAAMVIDGFIASKIDSDNAMENERSPSAVQRNS